MPVAVFFRVTVAPGTTAPEESLIVPRTVAVSNCARAVAGSSNAATNRPTTTRLTRRGRRGMYLPLEKERESARQCNPRPPDHRQMFMPSLFRDVRHAIRLLVSRPAFGLTITATIALAIAGNTLMFGLVRGVLLSPLPLPAPDRLVRIEQVHQTGASNVTGATFVDVRSRARSLEAIAAVRIAPVTFSTGDLAVQATAASITSDYFTVLGLHSLVGRLPQDADFTSSAEPTVFLSAETWRRLFNAESSVIGRSVLVNAAPRTVAGVIEVPTSSPGAADLWTPNPRDGEIFANRRARLFTTIGRLRPDATPASATAELQAIAATIVRESPQAGRDMSLVATPLRDRIVQPVRSSLLLLWAAVGVLVTIAFANVANLLLMEGSVRERELTLRTALGAPRTALIRQLAVEAATAGLIGGVAGALLGGTALAMVRRMLPASLPRAADVHVDAPLVLSSIALSIVAAILFGLVPAIRASRRDAASALRPRDGGGARSRLRDVLVAAEVALTLVLLFGAALLARSLFAAAHAPLGFSPANAITADLSLPAARYPDTPSQARFYGAVIERLSAVQGVEAIGVTGALPLTPTAATTMVAIDGPDDQQPVADVIAATPGFFPALRMSLVRGRLVAESDREGTLPVAVVNETAARTLWPNGADPLGRIIEMRDWGEPYRTTVVGVIEDVRQAGGDQAVRPAVYYPLAQFPPGTLTQTIVVRSSLPASDVLSRIRSAIHDLDPTQPLGIAAPMTDRIATALAPRRFNLLLLAAFACAALLLAAVGIYGIVAFAIAARTREIGIRVALGASPRQIAWLAVSRGAMPIAAGALLGAFAAWPASSAMAGLVFGVGPRDAMSIVLASALIGVAAAAAIAGPAWRAVRT